MGVQKKNLKFDAETDLFPDIFKQAVPPPDIVFEQKNSQMFDFFYRKLVTYICNS